MLDQITSTEPDAWSEPWDEGWIAMLYLEARQGPALAQSPLPSLLPPPTRRTPKFLATVPLLLRVRRGTNIV